MAMEYLVNLGLQSFLTRLLLSVHKHGNLIFDMHSEYGCGKLFVRQQFSTVKGLRQLMFPVGANLHP